ncbi:hypothetical protein MOQ72_01150 [Saccharopolyspora sp. K220]|uniref:hypothetical protein n=1 Tax=Saccharopolyspora soli TaxID=2926618 RepID=UPI001F56F4C4|nr:hypothetical protein [Saccharopolyspora soli]MCI2416018.1 hypothetical protein [Saccharopolyspora soli]
MLARVVAAVIGGLFLVAVTVSVARTLVIARSRPGMLTRLVSQVVATLFVLLTWSARDYPTRDRILAAQPVTFLAATLAAWLVGYFVGYTLLLWPWEPDLAHAAREAGSSLFTLGFSTSTAAAPSLLDFLAAATGLLVVALQIAYLPTLYSAFNRRETDVTLLGARAGSPPWGPELLARTRYGIRLGEDDLTELYRQWERWAADIAESHSNYPVLIRFRSPQPMHSWLVGLLAVMDSAALLLALCPSRDRIEPRLCLRMGFTALRQIATSIGIPVDEDPDPDAEIQLSYQEYRAGVAWLAEVGFAMERTPEEAWPHFRGWRVNYEATAYALAATTDAVPALWSGPRRWPSKPIPPVRPSTRRPGDAR